MSDEWVGTNRDWRRGKSGGVGFVIKSEMFWGDLLCINGDAIHGIKKETVDGGMRNGVGYISEKELKRAIKLLKKQSN